MAYTNRQDELARQTRYNASPRGRASRRRWAEQYPDRIEAARLMRTYGLDRQQAEVAAVSAQGDLCAVCRRFKILVVDHNHTTGEARGMVCKGCNFKAGVVEGPLYAHVRAYVAKGGAV